MSIVFKPVKFNGKRLASPLLTASIVLGSSLSFVTTGLQVPQAAHAETTSACDAGTEIFNQATLNYDVNNTTLVQRTAGVQGRVQSIIAQMSITAERVTTTQGEPLIGGLLGRMQVELTREGLSSSEAQQAVMGLAQAWLGLKSDATLGSFSATVNRQLETKLGDRAKGLISNTSAISPLYRRLVTAILQEGMGSKANLPQLLPVALSTWRSLPDNTPLPEAFDRLTRAIAQSVPEQGATLSRLKAAIAQDFAQLKTGRSYQGRLITFRHIVRNTGTVASYLNVNQSGRDTQVTLKPGQIFEVLTTVQIRSVSSQGDTLRLRFAPVNPNTFKLQIQGSGEITNVQTLATTETPPAEAGSTNAVGICPTPAPTPTPTPTPSPTPEPPFVVPPSNPDNPALVDPLGQVTSCSGGLLPDYTGINVGLYFPADGTGNSGEVTGTVPLTQTEVPDDPSNSIPLGLAPNIQNANPYFLTNGTNGLYNFLLDVKRGQLEVGAVYILVVKTAPNSSLGERRIRLKITNRTATSASYTATALDGLPISVVDAKGGPIDASSVGASTEVNGVITIADAATAGLGIAILGINAAICDAQAIQILKTGDRASAQPGDIVIYRLTVKNLSSVSVNRLVVSDTLPRGLEYRGGSVRAQMNETPVEVSTTANGSNLTFQFPNLTLPPGDVVTIAYAVTLTPDALRGSGINSAIANGQRIDNGIGVKDGPAQFRIRVRPGILTDAGTIVGRVFEDKNQDGEQQKGEPGIPNAVIFMDDGNRITTDVNGLFSLANVLPGYRSGVLDLTSIPGYTLAPNLRFKERNSPSRLVHLSPGGLVRMNFGVSPVAQPPAMSPPKTQPEPPKASGADAPASSGNATTKSGEASQ